MLYQDLRLGYYRAVNLHTDKIQLGRMRYKEFFLCTTWRTWSEFWVCCMGARECSLYLSETSSLFFPCQTERQPREDEEYFCSHWEKLAALLVGKFQISADCAACCQDFHAPSNRQMCLSNLWFSSTLKCGGAALKTHNLKPCCINSTLMLRSKLKFLFKALIQKYCVLFFFSSIQ